MWLVVVLATSSIEATFEQFYKEWERIPYKYGGDSHLGIDCSALVRRWLRIWIPGQIPRSCHGIYIWLRLTLGWHETERPTRWGLVFWEGTNPRKPPGTKTHIGIIIGVKGQFSWGSVFITMEARRPCVALWLRQIQDNMTFMGGEYGNTLGYNVPKD